MLDCMSILPQSSLDRRLMRAAAKYASPEEMSTAVLGQLTPAQCIVRRDEILASKTTMDEIQERRILLISIAEHLDWLKDQRDNSKAWPAIARTQKLLSDQIERTTINVNDVSTKLAEAHAATYVEAYMLGFHALLRALTERDMINVEPEVMQELATLGIEESSRYLEGQTQRVVGE